jgi:hypothetical protein
VLCEHKPHSSSSSASERERIRFTGPYNPKTFRSRGPGEHVVDSFALGRWDAAM